MPVRGRLGLGEKLWGHAGKMQVPEPVPRRGSSHKTSSNSTCSRCAGKQGERSRQHAGARCPGSEPSCSAKLSDTPSRLTHRGHGDKPYQLCFLPPSF